MMMQAIYGNDFSVLDIKDQTKIIVKAGKDALAVDSEAACIRREYLRADRVTKDLYAARTDVKHLLMDIATHRCVSKEPDIQCLDDRDRSFLPVCIAPELLWLPIRGHGKCVPVPCIPQNPGDDGTDPQSGTAG